MGKAKWWVCDDCKSLNDLPANKCYKCRSVKPAAPTLMDDQYGQVSSGAQQRVSVSVDLSQVGQLTAPDPLEKAKGGEIIEAYGFEDDKPLEMSRDPLDPSSPPPPLREPKARSISEVGGQHWADSIGSAARPAAPPPPQVPSPPAQAPPLGEPPMSGGAPPPGAEGRPLMPPPPAGAPPAPAAQAGPPMPPPPPPPGAAPVAPSYGVPPVPPPSAQATPPGQVPPLGAMPPLGASPPPGVPPPGAQFRPPVPPSPPGAMPPVPPAGPPSAQVPSSPSDGPADATDG